MNIDHFISRRWKKSWFSQRNKEAVWDIRVQDTETCPQGAEEVCRAQDQGCVECGARPQDQDLSVD